MQELTREDIVDDLHMAVNWGSPKQLSLFKECWQGAYQQDKGRNNLTQRERERERERERRVGVRILDSREDCNLED